MTSPPPALEVRNLTTGYGSTVVLRDVSLSVPAGSVTALLGANGAGKTTLLRSVCGFLPVMKGSVHLFGATVTRTRAHRRFRMGLCHVPEGRGVFRSLTVRENLLLQAGGGRKRAAIERALDAFPILGERLNQAAGTLSGGQQQMLAMCAAYISDPQLILVDEASLGLGPVVVDEVFTFLSRLAHRGAALLIVDQFANRALEIADSAYVLTHGSITYDGPAKRLLDSDMFATYLGTAAPATTP